MKDKFVGIAKGLKQSQKTVNKKIGNKNGSYGSFWITNGKDNKRIKDQEIPKGWWKGRVFSGKKASNSYK